MIVEKVEPKPDWPAWCVNEAGKRVRFDSAQEMWPGYRREGKQADAERNASIPPPMAPASFRTGDTILLNGEPFVLRRPAKPGRKPNESAAP